MKLTGWIYMTLIMTGAGDGSTAEMQRPSLRERADQRGFRIGAAVAIPALRNDRDYANVLSREFNILTPENTMKFWPLHPERDRYYFDDADFLVDFAARHEMQVHGHTLVWHQQVPKWLTEGQWTRRELIGLLSDHIRTVVGRYRGRIAIWDVVNEAVSDTGGLRPTFWSEGIGPDYLDLAFRLAHEADPGARLFYNDYDGENLGPKSDAIHALVKGMLERGVPIHGVGLQMHVQLGAAAWAGELSQNIRRLNDLGLEVQITEMDVRLPMPPSPDAFKQQANVYRKAIRACLDAPNCTAFITWGFTDKYSWIPKFFNGFGAALPLDEQYNPKPAYEAIAQELGRKELSYELY